MFRHRERFNKKVLVFYFVFGMSTNLFIIAMILPQGRVEAWHLVTSVSLGSLGVTVYYPASFASPLDDRMPRERAASASRLMIKRLSS